MAELVIRAKDDTSVTMTIRISKKLKEKYDELAADSGYSRNHLMSLAMQFAVDNMRIEEKNA